MPRYIDADQLKTIKSIQSANFNSIETIREWIDAQQTADVQKVRHGKWEEVVIPSGYSNEVKYQSARCSVCKRYHTTPYLYTYYEHNYCPNCGARMEKE